MMKNLIFTLVFCLPFFVNGQCPNGPNIILGSQQDIIDFISDFPNCTELDASLVLTGSVSDLNLLSQLVSIEGNLGISGTSQLTNLNGLSSLTTINGMLEIQLNGNLTNIQGLENLTNDVWAIRIMNNNSLNSLVGLENVTTLNDELYVYGNPVLENLNGLNNLTFVQSHCEIYQNNLLNDISALSNLNTINGQLKIYSNPNLSSIQALDNISTLVTNVEIYDCPLLSVCDIQPVCNFIQNGGVAVINNNAVGCNNIGEIESSCPIISTCSVSPPGPFGWIQTNCMNSFDLSVQTFDYTAAITFAWDFGDGSTATGSSSITHTFQTSGTFEVCVTASDGICSDTYCQDLTANNPIPIFSNIPNDVTIEATDSTNCWNDVYQINPVFYIDECDPNSVNNTATCTRSDGMSLSAPWEVGVTTVTCIATGVSGQTAEVSWNVILENTNCDCEEPEFVNLFGNGSNNTFYKVEEYDDGIYALGVGGSSGAGLYAVFIKFDLDGSILWERRFSNGEQLLDFIREGDNFILVGGNIPFGFSSKSLVCSVNNSGNLNWTRVYDFLDRERFTRIAKAPASPQPEFYIWGQINKPGTSSVDDENLLKIDIDGNEIFRKTFSFDGDAQLYSHFLQLQNGNYIFFGQQGVGQIGGMNPLATEAWRGEEGTGSVELRHAVETNDKIYVVGRSNGNGYILVLNNEGTQKLYRYNLPDVNMIIRVAADHLGNLYLLTRGDIGDGIVNRHIIYKVSELYQSGNTSELSVDWVKYINQGETDYSGGSISINDEHLVFQDSRLNHPNAFGNVDILLGVFDLDMNGECIDTLNHTISSPVFVGEFITENFPITDQTIPSTTTFSMGANVSHSINALDCSTVSCDEDNFCSTSNCSTDTLLLNTGFNHFENGLYSYDDYDNFWELVEAPIAGLNLPRPAFVIPPYPENDPGSDWAVNENTNWISAFTQPAYEINNEAPLPPYTMQNCFCICDDAAEVKIYMEARADDRVSINLVDDNNNLITPLLVDHDGFKYYSDPGYIDTTLILNQGTYCISAEMRNIGQVAMGLNIEGYLTGGALINPVCCGNTNGYIVGTKFQDRNCNGVRDNANAVDGADHEEGLSGWEISLCDVNQNVIETTTTDELGYYVFNEVEPGDYLVKETQQADWEATNMESQTFHSVTVDTAEVVSDIDFANRYNGPVEFEGTLDCAVSGETIPIRWIGGDCNCNISLRYRECNNPASSEIDIIFFDGNNPGGYDWVVPSNLPMGTYEIILESCDELGPAAEIYSQCFDVMDIDLSYTAEVGICGEIIFMASSTPTATYSWNFGDSSPSENTSAAIHQYDTAGPYTVTLTATTMEGCEKSISFTVSPENDIFPNIDCPPAIMIGENDSIDPSFTGMATGSDDCGFPVEIVYSDSVTGECPGGGITINRQWGAINTFGVGIYCSQIITIECEPTTTSVTGTALQPNGNPICDVMIVLSGDIIDTTFTDENGFYEFPNIPPSSNITVTPSLDENHLCGVDQLDIDIITDHVTDIQLFSTPFEYIAADANNDGTVSSFDNFPINLLINGSITSFPDNTSWRFIDANYVFPNPTNPFTPPFPEDISLSPILGNEVVNFTGIKIGDVNNDCNMTCDTCDLTVMNNTFSDVCYGGIAFGNVVTNGGTLPFTYSWFSNGQLVSNEVNLSLSAGTYEVMVTDANGCTASEEIIINSVDEIIIDPMVTNCTEGGQNGAIDISVTGGVLSPYYYQWSTGATTEDLTELGTGTYTVTVSDNMNCSATLEVTLSCDTCNLFADIMAANVTCNGSNDGAASAAPIGGTMPFTYLWSTNSSSADLFGIIAGTYTVTISDTDGCTASEIIEINEPNPLASIYFASSPTCSDLLNGMISLDVSGGMSPYTYLWSTGATTEDISGLGGGAYTVTITDANGCSILDATALSEPNPITISGNVTNASCGIADGIIELNITGGFAPYTFQWSSGATTSIISNLTPGTYTGTVIDINGCFESQTFAISEDCFDCEVTVTGGLIGCDNIEFTAIPNGFTNDPVTYTWTGMGGASPISPNSATTQVVYDGPDLEVTLCVEATDGICIATNCFTVPIIFPNPSFVSCPSDINFSTETDDCVSDSDVASLIALSGCNNAPVTVNCIRSDNPNFTLSDPWPLGTTMVTCIATDDIYGGVSDTCTFTVTVSDNAPPLLTDCPIDITLDCDASQSGVVYDFSLPNAIDNCAGSNQLMVSCSHPSGSVFPVGMTTVTCSVIDLSGNESLPCEFIVTVEECLSICCSDTLGFCNRFDAGFTSYADACDINLSAVALDTCDILNIDWGDGTTTNLSNNFNTNHTYSQSGDYEICATAGMLAADGSVCYSKDTCWMICVECDGCDNPMFSKEWTHAVADVGNIGHEERVMGLAVESNIIYVSGAYVGAANFGHGALSDAGNSNMFWAKYTNDGTLIKSFGTGGELDDYANMIEPDVVSDGYYVGGNFLSEEITLPSTIPNNEQFLGDSKGIFIAKYDSNDELIWAQNFGEAPHVNYAYEILRDITIDPQGNIYLVGRYHYIYPINFGGDTLPGTSSFLDGFVAKLSPSGEHIWSMPISGEGVFANVVSAVDTDSNGNVYITGGFGGQANFNPRGDDSLQTGSCLNCSTAATNMFLAKYSPDGILNWVVNAGASTSYTDNPNSNVQGWDVKVDGDNVYLTGQMKGQGTEFNPKNIDSSIILSNDPNDTNLYGFLGKYNTSDGEAEWAFGLKLNGKPLGLGIDPQGNVAIAGYFFKPSLDIDPDQNTEFNLSSYAKDGFIAKYNPSGELITGMNLYGNGYDELQDAVFDDEGNLYTIGFNASSNLDDDPISPTNPLLNSEDAADIFFGKYDCNCSSTEATCCEDLEATITALDTCCYSLDLSNNYGFSVTEIEIIMNTADVIFNQNEAFNGFQFEIVTDDLLSITHSSGMIPSGESIGAIEFCLAKINGTTPPNTQDLTINWKGLEGTSGQTSLLCEEEETTQCDFMIMSDCVAFNELEINCSSESNEVYTIDFTVTNQSNVQAEALVINSQTSGFTLTECFVPSMFSETNIIYSFGNTLMTGETSDDICLKIVSPELIQEPTEFCFTLSLEGGIGNETCCSEVIEYCVILAPCCLACDVVEVISETWQDGNGDCCYEIDISNECANGFFSGVEVTLETDDVIFGTIGNGSNNEWSFTADNQQSMTWHINEDYIPTGFSENIIQFCLDGIDGDKVVRFDWLVPTDESGTDSVYCSETLTYQCDVIDNPCLDATIETIYCDTITGAYTMIIDVDNNSDFDATQLNFITSQDVFIAGGVSIFNPAIASGESRKDTVLLFPTVFPFDESHFEFSLSLKDLLGDSCCQESLELVVPAPVPCYVGIEELESYEHISIYPNPFTEGFTILFEEPNNEKFDVTIWDIYGRKIIEDQIGIGEKQFQLSPENIAAGVYLLQLQNASGQSLIRKLVKN